MEQVDELEEAAFQRVRSSAHISTLLRRSASACDAVIVQPPEQRMLAASSCKQIVCCCLYCNFRQQPMPLSGETPTASPRTQGDDRPKWPALPRADLFAALTKSLWMTGRDLATMTVRCACDTHSLAGYRRNARTSSGSQPLCGRRRIYEWLASRMCSPRTTWKLLKGESHSSVTMPLV